MSRGFHAFFRQYYNLRALLRRVDPGAAPAGPARRTTRWCWPAGTRDSFARIPRTPPLNMAAFVAQSPTLPRCATWPRSTWPRRWSCSTSTSRTPSPRYDGESAAAVPRPAALPGRRPGTWRWRSSPAASSPHPSDFSAGELVAMFHTYFLGSAEGLLFDVPDDDYDTALWAPLRSLPAPARGRGPDRRERVDASCAAASRRGRGHARARGERLGGRRRGARRPIRRPPAICCSAQRRRRRRRLAGPGGGDPQRAPPFAVWRLWLDRPVDADAAGVPRHQRLRSAGQRHRARALRGRGPALGRARTAARWSSCTRTRCRRTGDEHDAAGPAAGRAAPDLSRDCRRRGASPRSGWSAPTARWSAPARGGAGRACDTPDPRLVLAGDGIRCDYPGRPDGAGRHHRLPGRQPAAGRRGLAGHDLWTVPMRSRNRVSAPLHRLLTR